MIATLSHVLMTRPVTQEMTIRQLRTLVVASEHADGVDLGRAAKAMKVSTPAMTRATDRLTERSLVTRVVNATDRRRVFIKITKEGRKLIADINRDITKAQAVVARRLVAQSECHPQDDRARRLVTEAVAAQAAE